MKVKDCTKNGTGERVGRGGEERIPLPLPLFHFLALQNQMETLATQARHKRSPQSVAHTLIGTL